MTGGRWSSPRRCRRRRCLLFHLESPASDIAVITINDPKKGANILSRPALAEFDELLTTLEKRTDLAGLIIRSTKPGNFIAGADLREFVADIDAPPNRSSRSRAAGSSSSRGSRKRRSSPSRRSKASASAAGRSSPSGAIAA